eukprot:TRINITY_DN90997_c0_g1_i1.p1 TRINITY_DN90997_c0_g1~~TRINITY_DN90997_c0_g1_i1.p1  ORF type:complete len:382 (-),score=106.22 TRINITY_DN90997_c0_g1_i1:286-1431(-)
MARHRSSKPPRLLPGCLSALGVLAVVLWNALPRDERRNGGLSRLAFLLATQARSRRSVLTMGHAVFDLTTPRGSGVRSLALPDSGSDAPATAEAEVVSSDSAGASRPAQLLASPGMQAFLGVASKLQQVKEGESSVLKVVVGKMLNELGDLAIPDDFQADFDEATVASQKLAAQVMETTEDIESMNWQPALLDFSRLRLAKRVPEMVERITPWDKVYTTDLEQRAGVPRDEVKAAFRDFAEAAKLDEVAVWSEAEFDEAADLVEKEPALKEVFDTIGDIGEEAMSGMFQEAAGGLLRAALVPVVFLVIGLVACCNLVAGGNPPTGPVPSADELGTLPLYKLAAGSSTAGGAPVGGNAVSAASSAANQVTTMPTFQLGAFGR